MSDTASNGKAVKHFTGIKDVADPMELVKKALDFKAKPLAAKDTGTAKTLGLIFFNPSLRTRLSTLKAAANLGMEVVIMDINRDGWKLETKEGAVMDGDRAEHIKDAAAVIGQYCDVLGIRSFPELKDRKTDYKEETLNAFLKYAGTPIVNLESATLHPLQSLADLITIEEYKLKSKPKVTLTWTPHVKPLPQSVANSFAQWMNHTDYEFTIAAPEGFDLSQEFTGNAPVFHNQREALKGADFVYAKNWSSFHDYGKTGSFDDWIINESKMKLTNSAGLMHCLPVRRNVVATDQVLDSENAIHIPQAGNRIWAAQAVLHAILSGDG